MIYRSENDILSDRTGDQADSAVRASMLSVFSNRPESVFLYVRGGYILRSPDQMPAANKLSTTRDQMIPIMAALWKTNSSDIAKSVFWETAKRGFFSQSTERDWPGSKKHLYPHQFFKDSKPDTTTIPMKWNWSKFKFETTLISNEEHEVEYKYFDGPDILAPDHIWHFILCARIRWLYWFSVVGYPWLYMSILFHSKSLHKEHNQLLCQCVVAGSFFVKTFKKRTKNYEEDLRNYWGSRNEYEYCNHILNYLNKYD